MPLYEYSCRQCDHQFEELVFGSEPVSCPKCRGEKLERLISVPGRPRVEGESGGLPMTCRSEGPPCGPQCRRL